MTLKPNKWLRAVRAILAAALLVAATPARSTETYTFIHTDMAGSPVAATDINGNLVWTEGYRPYGERTKNLAAAASNRQFFHGKAFDADTGVSYFGARYYDPMVGRFMGVDPQGFVEENLHSFNRYAYGNNNPFKYVDPDGRVAFLVFLVPILKGAGYGALASGGAAFVADAASQIAAFGGDVSVKGSLQEAWPAAAAGALGGAAIGGGIVASQLARGLISEAKLGYAFGQASGRVHNVDRAVQNATQLARVGVHDTAAGRELLRSHLEKVASDPSNVARTFSNQWGDFVVKESLFAGPAGFLKLESTWQVLKDGGLRFTTLIPLGG